MLKKLCLKNIGPAPEMNFDFGERLNILTGDNGLGKTFLLDIAWWALTKTWVDARTIHPRISTTGDAAVEYEATGKDAEKENNPITRKYNRSDLDWSPVPAQTGRPRNPGLVIYARIDGGISVWDPERNYGKTDGVPSLDAFHFSKSQIRDGVTLKLPAENEFKFRGLLEDWETWRLKGNGAFGLLKEVLYKLSPDLEHPLEPGNSVRVTGRSGQDIPTIKMPYGEEPILWSSAGMMRILSLAYMIVWAWTEHQLAGQERKHSSENRIIFLWDEVEAHLHPQWQRAILPAVLEVFKSSLLKETGNPKIQIITTTHAPLVLASLEAHFDEEQDKLFNLQLTGKSRQVEVEDVKWAKFGDTSSWLRSPAFDMISAYSKEAETALRAGKLFLEDKIVELKEKFPTLSTEADIEKALIKNLPDAHPFHIRWEIKKERRKK
jgi:hypothetical protein